ncbi:metallophosphoesterase [Clostridia bacterium]|nr:metallophosphoesterase [Clostridia bacterium]
MSSLPGNEKTGNNSRLFAIGDLHLSFSNLIDKPMDVFGAAWHDHTARLEAAWREDVAPGDTVIVLGDISWALKTEDAMPDLEWIHALPGRKILLRGNHDLWWHGITNLNTLWPGEMIFLQNNCVMLDRPAAARATVASVDIGIAEGVPSLPAGEGSSCIAVCGSRGWGLPGLEDYGKDDEKILARELIRIRMSFEAATLAGADAIVCALHFPPAIGPAFESSFTELIESWPTPVTQVVYGHLHTPSAFRKGLQGEHGSVRYSLASADYLGFKPLRIL